MTTHSSILAWRILWTDEPGGTVHGVIKSWTPLNTYTHVLGLKNPENTRKDKEQTQSAVQKQYFALYTHAYFVYECLYT